MTMKEKLMVDDKTKAGVAVPGKMDKVAVTDRQERPAAGPATAPTPPPVAASPAPTQAERTVIARGTEFEGSVVSSCGVTLDGKLRGKLRAPSLVLNATGTVDGEVEVEELSSSGSLAGRIKAKTVQLSGRVNDSTVIRAETLEVKLSQPGSGMQVSFGNCELKVGDVSAAASAATSKPNPPNPPKPGKPSL
jgi:cytoskeletal protein CcmA (bactofilin family)